MPTRYKAHHPEHYPIAWLSAAKIAVEKRGTDNPWVSVDWARGESGAVSRMKRLRSFRDGLHANRYNYREVAEVIDAGYDLTFRKVSFRDVLEISSDSFIGTDGVIVIVGSPSTFLPVLNS